MIFLLIVILFLLMSIIGGERGTKSFFTLIVNALIGIGCLYLIALGTPPLAVMIGSSFLFCFFTIVYQNGANKKSLASLLAIMIVVVITSLLIYYICLNTHISGFTEIELQEEDTPYLSSGVGFKMRYLLLMAMIWGQLGAISDTSMAIATALNEIHFHHPDFSVNRLYHEGMIIGKDILGTTINTLFFVSLGEAIMLYLYYETYQYSLLKILNLSSFAQTIFPVLLPCIGCILIIPLTAFLFAVIAKNTFAIIRTVYHN